MTADNRHRVMEKYELYEIKAKSFEGRIPVYHRFEMPGKDKSDVLTAIVQRWPELYDIEITKKTLRS